MKKLILAAIAVFPSVLFAQEDFTISGKVGSLNAPAKAYISYRSEGVSVLDSADVVNGVFTFNGSVASPTRGLLLLLHKGENIMESRSPDRLDLYFEKGNIKVTSADSIANAMVEGGELNRDFSRYLVASSGPKNKMNQLIVYFSAASAEERQDPEFMSEVQEEAMAIEQEQKVIDLAFIRANTNSQVSLELLIPHLDSEPIEEVIEPLFNSFPARLKDSDAGRHIASQMENLKKTDIGAIAPDFTQPDTAGNMIALSSFRGKYVLIDFWASWCGPCREENPNVVAAYHKFKDKNFTIFGVSLDRPGQKEAWIKAIQDDELQDWPHVSDLKFWQSPVVEQYAIQGIPQNFLLDPEGRIVAKNLRGDELHIKLAEILD